MDEELRTRRRVLAMSYRRYLMADQAWHAAVQDAGTWFPEASRPYRATIGAPGSPVRALYEQRERAIGRLTVAQIKLHVAKRRLAERRQRTAWVLRLMPP